VIIYISLKQESLFTQAEDEFYLSSSNRRAIRENDSVIEDIFRTCMLDHLGGGMKCCLWWSSPTTKVIRKSLVWHRTRLCMDKDAELLCVGTKMER